VHSLFEVSVSSQRVNCTPVGPPEGLWQTISAAVVLGNESCTWPCLCEIAVLWTPFQDTVSQ